MSILRSLFAVAIPLCLVVNLVGCDQPLPASSFTITQPETIEVDGEQWKKEEWGGKIEAKLDKHFRKTPQLAENPALNGDAVCYSSGSKQRVYWLSSIEGACQWAMIEFKGSRGSQLTEGSGAPFLEVVVVDQ